jgi:hypothetical protein
MEVADVDPKGSRLLEAIVYVSLLLDNVLLTAIGE